MRKTNEPQIRKPSQKRTGIVRKRMKIAEVGNTSYDDQKTELGGYGEQDVEGLMEHPLFLFECRQKERLELLEKK